VQEKQNVVDVAGEREAAHAQSGNVMALDVALVVLHNVIEGEGVPALVVDVDVRVDDEHAAKCWWG